MVELKNKAHMPVSEISQPRVIQRKNVHAIQLKMTGSRPVECAQNMKQRTFSRAGMPDNRQYFRPVNRQINPLQNVQLLHMIDIVYFFNASGGKQVVFVI
jgi:hypothetical protein